MSESGVSQAVGSVVTCLSFVPYLAFSSFISMCGRLHGSLKIRLKESGKILATSKII